MTNPVTNRLPPVELHGYRISQQLIAEGTTGSVFPAVDQTTGSPRVIKLAHPAEDDPNAVKNVKQEAAILERLSHVPHIVKMKTHFPLPAEESNSQLSSYALVLEEARCCERCPSPQNVRDKLMTKGIHAYGFKTIVSAIAQLVECLIQLNKLNLVHCDLKTSNLILNESGLLTLCDFANADSLDELVNDHSRTTATHRPPEMYLGKKETDFTVDMWGVGVILFELYTGGHVPFPWKDKDGWSPFRSILATLGFPSDDYLKSCPYGKDLLKKATNSSFFSSWRANIQQAAFFRGHSFTRTERIIDFLDRIFCYEKRMTAQEALRHPLLHADVQVHLDMKGASRAERDQYFLRIGNTDLPLSPCLHFPRSSKDEYRIQLLHKQSGECLIDKVNKLFPGYRLQINWSSLPQSAPEEKRPK